MQEKKTKHMSMTFPPYSQSCVLISQASQNFENIISLYILYVDETTIDLKDITLI